MRRVSILAASAFAALLLQGMSVADTASPVIWSQTPDMDGGLAYSSEIKVPSTVAGCWTCGDVDLAISKIKWWGAYWGANQAGAYADDSDSLPLVAEGGIQGFTVKLWTNTPAGTGGITFARPGTTVWTYAATSFTESLYGTTINKNRNVYEYSVDIAQADRFVHQQGSGASQYWISIVADMSNGGTVDTTRQWGWMESANSQYNAPAAVQDYKGSLWKSIDNNIYSSDMSFVIEDSPVPEPGSFASLAAGLVGMLGIASGIRRRS